MIRNRAIVVAIAWIAAGCGASGTTDEATVPDGEEPAEFGSCIGPVPANATLCPGAASGLTADAVRVVMPTCTCESGCVPTPCAYVCNPGFTPVDGACVPHAPAPSISVVQNGDGTVTVSDAHGTRVWLRDANCTESLGGVSRAAGPVTWYEAVDWVRALGSGACGLADGSAPGDWRLPDEAELASLVTDLATLGDEARGAFTGIQTRAYWTSFSTCVGIYGIIEAGTGVYSDVPATERYNVWPIRGR